MQTLLTVNDLSFGYSADKFFCKLNFALSSDRQRIALLGPDGAGKSTLLKLCAQLLTPQSGTLRLAVPPVGKNFNCTFTFMPQSLGLYDELTVEENLALFAALHGLTQSKERMRLDELLYKTGLHPFVKRQAGALSGGMRQKLALCTVLCARPFLLILDEPTVGVDPLSRRELWSLINDYLRDSGAYMLFSTAYLSEAQHADELLILDAGKLIYQGTPADLCTGAAGCCFNLSLPSMPHVLQHSLLTLMQPDSTLIDASPWGGKLRLQTKLPASPADLAVRLYPTLHEMLGDDHAFGVTQRTAQLEDAYIRLTHRKTDNILLPAQPPDFILNDVAVSLRHVVKRFGAFTALHDSSFNVKRGEIFGLLGPNGAGKTTTFRLMCSLLRPTQGTIELNGINIKQQKSAARLQLGYVAQRFSLYKKLSAQQNLTYFAMSCGLSGRRLQSRLAELVQEFGLATALHTPAGILSFGLQRNLSMACALLARPALLFLDEATSGADPRSRRIFWQRILSLAKAGTTVVVTTHFLEEAEYCDRMLIQHQGRILVCGSPQEICDCGSRQYSVEERFIALISAQQEGDRV